MLISSSVISVVNTFSSRKYENAAFKFAKQFEDGVKRSKDTPAMQQKLRTPLAFFYFSTTDTWHKLQFLLLFLFLFIFYKNWENLIMPRLK